MLSFAQRSEFGEADGTVMDEVRALDVLANRLRQVPEVRHREGVLVEVVVSEMLACR